jgi:WbqC-like protein family
MTIFPLYYFPPVSWFVAASREQTILIEVNQHYHKQHFYNRMRVPGPNKLLSLSVPVVRKGERVPLRESLISYDHDWQKNHWRSLEGAYRSSPWFEYYEDRFLSIYEQKTEKLADMNLAILSMLRDILLPDLKWELTTKFEPLGSYKVDYREAFDPSEKNHPVWYNPRPWTQVFGGFEPDPSVFDLLCNLGPEAQTHLNKCWIDAI